jgi:hypothetical protein
VLYKEECDEKREQTQYQTPKQKEYSDYTTVGMIRRRKQEILITTACIFSQVISELRNNKDITSS